MIRGKDIATRIGLSKETVSAVLSGQWRERRICPETRDRVLATARRLGYVPHHAARRLARARANNRSLSFDQVGIIYLAPPGTPHTSVDSVCLTMVQSAEHELSKLHASLTFVRVSESSDWDKLDRLSRAGGIDGWLLYGAVDDAVVNRLNRIGLPHVILGDHRCTQRVHSVTLDNFAVGRVAVQHLASLGHRRIAFLGSRLEYVYEQETLAGYRAAVKELGLDEDARLIGNLSTWMTGVSNGLMEWLRNAEPTPTAAFAAEFDFAPMVHRALKDEGIEVPGRISLVGYDTATPAVQREGFTRIELPMAEVGRQGALLLRRIASGEPPESGEIRVAPSLIEGWSTRPPRGCNSGTQN